MKYTAYLLISFLVLSCGSDRIYKKQVYDKHIKVNWFMYSYISNGSPDFVEVEKGNLIDTILVADNNFLQDISLKNDSIIISHLRFQQEPKIKKSKVFKYKVIYKQVSSHEMYLKHLQEQKQPAGR